MRFIAILLGLGCRKLVTPIPLCLSNFAQLQLNVRLRKLAQGLKKGVAASRFRCLRLYGVGQDIALIQRFMQRDFRAWPDAALAGIRCELHHGNVMRNTVATMAGVMRITYKSDKFVRLRNSHPSLLSPASLCQTCDLRRNNVLAFCRAPFPEGQIRN